MDGALAFQDRFWRIALLPQAEGIDLHYSADNMEKYNSRLELKQLTISVIDRLAEKI